MVKIADVVLGLRSRLGDTDTAKHHYSDPEIIDAVNSALAHLSEDLLCFRRTWLVPCHDGVGRYELPGDFLRLISVNFKGELMTNIESMEHRMNRLKGASCPGVSLDLQTVHIFPSSGVKEDDVIELYYNYFETISDARDTVALPNNAKEALIYFALAMLYENPVKKNGIERSNRYRQLYQIEVQKVASRVRMNAQSKNMKTSYQKV